LKYTIRYKWWKILIYGFITTTQRCKGITSKTDRENYHYVLWDFDNTPLYNVKEQLEMICMKYNLIGAVIFSDKENSYRAFSETVVDYKTLLKIILETEYVDRMFFKWTVKRGYATIRISNKKNRPDNNIIAIVGRPSLEYVKEKLKFVEYDTDE